MYVCVYACLVCLVCGCIRVLCLFYNSIRMDAHPQHNQMIETMFALKGLAEKQAEAERSD